jgi:uncharacterized protein (TIGR02001 family)
MQKVAKALCVAGATALPFLSTAARADDPPVHSFTGKVALYTEYEYRGISQTSEKPALQLNLDYAHNSGLYIGTFLSNIKWLKDTADVNGFSTGARVEWDIYGGYKHAFGDVTMDVGYLRYEYPSSGAFDRPVSSRPTPTRSTSAPRGARPRSSTRTPSTTRSACPTARAPTTPSSR